MSVSVCLSVRSHISETALPNFKYAKYFRFRGLRRQVEPVPPYYHQSDVQFKNIYNISACRFADAINYDAIKTLTEKP